jgi:hypothetical protein
MSPNPRSKRRAISTPGQSDEPTRRSPAGIVASVAIHVVVIAVLMRMVIGPRELDRLLGTKKNPLPVQSIGFLALPKSQTTPKEPPRSGGDNRAVRRTATPPPPPIVAPSAVPTAIAPPTTQPAPPEVGGSGAVVGSGGATQGVRPSFSDPRVWAVPPAPVVMAPLTPKQRLDSAIVAMVQTLEDSLARLPQERAPGDWTYTHNGKKYGIDGKLIHLGNFSLPTAILAMLPLNTTANPSALERDRRLSVMRGEIQTQAARAARDEDFYRAVKALRDRKEKERAEQKKAAADQANPVIIP